MTTIPSSPTVLWDKTETALREYTSEKKVWLRRVVTKEGEYLEAKEVSLWMRISHFFGGWKLPDVASFLANHTGEYNQFLQQDATKKLVEAAASYNKHSILRTKVQDTTINNLKASILPKEKRAKVAVAKPKELIKNNENLSWILSVNAKTADLPAKILALRNLLKNPSDTPENLLITIKHLLKRYDQLGAVNIETVPLAVHTRMHLAAYIELTLPDIKKTFEATGKAVPRDVLVMKNKRIVIMAKTETSKLQAEGTYKKVYSAALVPLKRKVAPSVTVQAHINPEKDEVAATEQELKIFELLADEPGFVKMHTYCKIPPSGKITKFRVVYEAFEGSLLALTSSQPAVKLTHEQKVDMAQQIISAMATMHKKGIIHFDLKVENVLYRMQDGRPITGVTDFGLCIQPKAKGKTDISKHLMSDGVYGTKFATPPELIGVKNDETTKERLEKLDTWACGLLLYELFYQTPPWHKDLNIEEELTPQIQATVIQKVQETIEKPLAALLKKPNPSAQDRMKILIFQMLQTDPNKRPTMAKALQNINELVHLGN